MENNLYDKSLITAISLNNSNAEILTSAEEKVIAFNRKRIRKALTEAKKLKRIEANDTTIDLTAEETEAIKLSLINDEEARLYRLDCIKDLTAQKSNYNEIRKDIHNLNDLWYDSYDIEKLGIQKYENLLNYDELVLQSTHNTPHYFEMHKTILDKFKSMEIDIYNTIHDEQNKRGYVEDLNYKTLAIFLQLREMYQVTKEMDDFEVFERYGLESNIDVAHKLSDIFIYLAMSGNKDQNIVNMFTQENLSSKDSRKLENIAELMRKRIISDKMLGYLFSNKFISNNSTITLPSTYTDNI